MAIAKKRASSLAAESVLTGRSSRDPITIPRLVPRGKSAFDTVGWRLHDALIKAADGKVIFELKGIRAPSTWSETSINIAASKYFRIIDGQRETSIEGMIRRVTHWIGQKGLELGYFDTAEETGQFEESLSYLMVQQMAAFNSPVWFNVGVR
ncbi:MAG TPA: vitamin B12-dependent ribonucleotide reductase, partial [Thermoplasmata archaeon]|nr:vitamin B12-dependent ribonucleotide reductase [Thermoplasmata archaeon]